MVLETYLDLGKTPFCFLPKNIVEIDLFKMLEAARWAPSAENQQVWRFVVVTSSLIKSSILKAIEAQDPRLATTSGLRPTPLTSKDLDRMRWSFSQFDYDPTSDPFRDNLKETVSADYTCAETAGALIICGFQSQFLGRAFGEVELGGAVLNLYLTALFLGYRARIIRNFDRDLVRIACKFPEPFNIQVIIAIGAPPPEDSLPVFDNKMEESRVKSGISLVDLMLDRRSIRDYMDKKVPEDIGIKFQHLVDILPTFARQKFVDLRFSTDNETLQKIAQSARIIFVKQKQTGKAPAIATISYTVKGASGFYGKTDIGMVFQAILMEAYALGIGTCWVGAFHHGSVRDILQIPAGWRIEGLITMGYPKEYPQPPPRLPIANIAHRDVWGAPLMVNRASKFARAGLTSLIRRNFKPTDAKTILRERDAGQPLVTGFKESSDGRISRGKKV